MATKTEKSYDQDGKFIDVVRRDADTDEVIDITRHEPYNNPFDFVNDDLGDVIDKEVRN